MKVSVNTKGVSKLFAQAPKVGETVIEDAYQYFRGITPIKTGNARSNTSLDKPGRTIEADYPYAGVLDAGRRMTSSGMRGSTQAPTGMSAPTLKLLDKMVRKELGKL
jgi:hypothetical protein